jgi:hypothetical protein
MQKDSNAAAPSELAVVDTFTKLIFGAVEQLDADELAIITALGRSDDGPDIEDLLSLGDYLRALGVSEMITLVERVRQAYPLSDLSPQEKKQFPASRYQPAAR